VKPLPDLILRAFLRPESLSGLSPEQWDLLVRQARRANILGKLAVDLETQGRIGGTLDAARPHLLSAAAVAHQQGRAIQWEVRCIREALAPTGVPVILLKGAAYVMAGLPACHGRVFSDVDLLVPKKSITEVETTLVAHGWTGGYHSAYDQRYYRKWMHEIPPMHHKRRGTVIDVHHAILPETARIKVNTAALWDAPVAVAGYDNIYVLQPTDMVIHSATHLFHEGELHNGLRDLFDLDSLLRHFGETACFWDEIVSRAKHLGLERPLYYALRYTKLLLETPIPQSVVDATTGPPLPIRSIMDFCYSRALRPDHASCADIWTPIARLALYVRSHWMRMPFFLLAYHLTHKALISEDQESKKEDKPPQADQPAR
jgi:hypothetical protein